CRSPWLPIMAAIALLTGMLLLAQAEKLPLMAQRALSFLPAVPVDPIAKQGAQASTEWRVGMWKEVLPQVPRYLLKGKGYAIEPNDLVLPQTFGHHGSGIAAAGVVLAVDYHKGSVSVLMQLGIFVVLGFIWPV